jgi:hypothetical protein
MRSNKPGGGFPVFSKYRRDQFALVGIGTK